jgi:hypothetical protein
VLWTGRDGENWSSLSLQARKAINAYRSTASAMHRNVAQIIQHNFPQPNSPLNNKEENETKKHTFSIHGWHHYYATTDIEKADLLYGSNHITRIRL